MSVRAITNKVEDFIGKLERQKNTKVAFKPRLNNSHFNQMGKYD